MNFNDVIGQDDLKKVLSEAISDSKLNHAYLFDGPAGIGKKTIAEIFAQMIMCTDIDKSSDFLAPCGNCDNCVMFREKTHPDYHFFSTENETIKIKEIRDFFENINLTPHYSVKKIYVIDGAEKMTTQAQNCILKTLEEPPSDVVIILLTANKEMLLETINSRVLTYSFKKYSKEEIKQAVEESLENLDKDVEGFNLSDLSKSELSPEFVYNFSDGIIGKAIGICNDDDFKHIRDKTFNIIKSLETKKMKNMIEAIDEIVDLKKIKEILEFFISYYRDVLVLTVSEDDSALINTDKRDMIQDGRLKIDSKGIMSIFQNIKEALIALNTNANEGLVVERLLMKVREEYI